VGFVDLLDKNYSVIASVASAARERVMTLRELTHEPAVAGWYLIIVSIVFSVLFVIAGIDLPRLSSDFDYDPDLRLP
jgi:hypothetical protein